MTTQRRECECDEGWFVAVCVFSLADLPFWE
jgi:hypothetical protein